MAEQRLAVVTGTTSGIGREVGRGLALAGFRVVMHGRDRARTDAVVAEVRSSAPNAEVTAAIADLARRDDVERFATELAGLGPIAALVNNAAVVPHERVVTAEGLEAAFAVNVFAPFLLARRLGPAVERVITYFGGGRPNFELDDLQSARPPYDGWAAYCQSKNAVAAVTLELARRAEKPQHLVVLPGLVNTEGMRNLPGPSWWFGQFARLWARNPAQGARTPVWVASAPELARVTGKAFGNLIGSGWRNELALPAYVTDPEAGRRVWEACDALAGAEPADRAARG